MTISRVELQGQVTRTQDFTALKHNENNKGIVDQTNFQKQANQNVDEKLHQVRQSDDMNNQGKRFDAKEKGKGSYAGDGGNKKKKEQKEEDGKVILKGNNSFDIKI